MLRTTEFNFENESPSPDKSDILSGPDFFQDQKDIAVSWISSR